MTDTPRQFVETAPIHPALLAIVGVGGLTFAGYIFHLTNSTKGSIDDKATKPAIIVHADGTTSKKDVFSIDSLFTYDETKKAWIFSYHSPTYNKQINIIFDKEKDHTEQEAFTHLSILGTQIRDRTSVTLTPDDYFILIRDAHRLINPEIAPHYRENALVATYSTIERIRLAYSTEAEKQNNAEITWLRKLGLPCAKSTDKQNENKYITTHQ